MPESVTIGEREMLVSTLNTQREHVLGILEAPRPVALPA